MLTQGNFKQILKGLGHNLKSKISFVFLCIKWWAGAFKMIEQTIDF